MAGEERSLSVAIDRISIFTGRAAAWLTLFMVLVTFLVVIMRYVFDTGLIWLQESVTWMHAAVFMLGSAYTLQRDEHVRVDIFYRAMSDRRKAWVDLLGVVFFILPLCVFFVFMGFDYVSASWSIRETSREAAGLPFPFLPLLKTTLLIMPVAVLLQGVSISLNAIGVIRKR